MDIEIKETERYFEVYQNGELIFKCSKKGNTKESILEVLNA